MSKQVVILGAGFAGISIAHKLLKCTIPQVDGLKVILVSPNTHFYWNPAAVRGVVPGGVPDDKLFMPIAPAFTRYPEDRFEFFLGRAEGVDEAGNLVSIMTAQGQRKIPYDIMVIATGSKVGTLPIKHLGDQETTVAELHELQEKIKAAKSIIVAGAGPTGVETTAELGAAYGGKKDITLIVKGDRILSFMLKDLGESGEITLKKMGVKILHNVTVTESNESDSETTVKLSDGRILTTDLYLPLTGVHPNTSFLPKQWIDRNGNVIVNRHLKVEGSKNVYAIGDCSNLEGKNLFAVETQFAYLSEELDAVLTGKQQGVAKEYAVATGVRQYVTLGKNTGLGQSHGWKVPGFLVGLGKGRVLLMEYAPKLLEGKQVFRTKV